jgi:hypothetical protein
MAFTPPIHHLEVHPNDKHYFPTTQIHGRPENPNNIIDLLDFPTCPQMNFIGNEAL